jgi:hypothetical protein
MGADLDWAIVRPRSCRDQRGGYASSTGTRYSGSTSIVRGTLRSFIGDELTTMCLVIRDGLAGPWNQLEGESDAQWQALDDAARLGLTIGASSTGCRSRRGGPRCRDTPIAARRPATLTHGPSLADRIRPVLLSEIPFVRAERRVALLHGTSCAVRRVRMTECRPLPRTCPPRDRFDMEKGVRDWSTTFSGTDLAPRKMGGPPQAGDPRGETKRLAANQRGGRRS